MSRRVKTRLESMPGRGGRTAFAPGGQEQAVVSLLPLLAGREIAQEDGLARAVDRDRLGAASHVDGVTRLEQGLGGDEETLPVGNGAGDVVGQAAVGEADERPALHTNTISARSSFRRTRAAAVAPPATPPMMTTFMTRDSPCCRPRYISDTSNTTSLKTDMRQNECRRWWPAAFAGS